MKFVALILLFLTTTSCWRMPDEGEVSTLPDINNPTLIRKQQEMPGSAAGVSY